MNLLVRPTCLRHSFQHLISHTQIQKESSLFGFGSQNETADLRWRECGIQSHSDLSLSPDGPLLFTRLTSQVFQFPTSKMGVLLAASEITSGRCEYWFLKIIKRILACVSTQSWHILSLYSTSGFFGLVRWEASQCWAVSGDNEDDPQTAEAPRCSPCSAQTSPAPGGSEDPTNGTVWPALLPLLWSLQGRQAGLPKSGTTGGEIAS